MSKILIKIATLTCVFVATVICVSILTDTGNVDLTTKMSEATLPVVTFYHGEMPINELYGYTTKMDELTVRDTITPLQDGLALDVNIKVHQYDVEEISYEVRTLDTKRLLENKQVSEYEEKGGGINARLRLQNLLKEQTEYLLVLIIHTDTGPVYYYTRISKALNSHIAEALDFAVSFHEKSQDKEQSAELSQYLEPSDDEDNSTLQKVTIHSKLTQVTWADFNGSRIDKPVPSIKEIGDNDNTIILEYVMTSKGSNGESQYYNVEEYFRVGYSESLNRMALFNYERTMNQIFRVEQQTIADNLLQLGIRNKQVEQMANKTKTVVSFIQEGELWNYNVKTNQLSYIFSFRGVDGIDDQENIPWHDIKIMKVDEEGNTDFVVLGYMNRGIYEGKSGIAVYHYDSISNTVEEELFLTSNKAYHRLKEDWGKLFYISKDQKFYLIASDELYKIDINSQKASKVVTGLIDGGYSVSENGRYIAWQNNQDLNHGKIIEVMDLEGEKRHTIKAVKGEYIKPIGFINSDFVYGVAKVSDILEEGVNSVPFPMYRILIVDGAFQIVKDRDMGEYYVSDAYVEDNTVFLNRVYRGDSGSMEEDQYTIKGHKPGNENRIKIESHSKDDKQTQIQLAFDSPLLGKTPQVLTPKEIVTGKRQPVELEQSQSADRYYVYAAGKLVVSTKSVKEAVWEAEKQMGVVVDRSQNYIWRIGKSEIVPALENVVLPAETDDANSTNRCLMAIIQLENITLDAEWVKNQQDTSLEILKKALPDRIVLDLSGCTMEEVLYFVDQGTPILAETGNEKAILIIGYDKYNVWIYDPETNATQKMGKQDSMQIFQDAGNRFIGYIKQGEY